MADSLALVGMGPANLGLFLNLVKQTRDLEYFAEGKPLSVKKIYLIDYEGNHGGGKAWGRHAHPGMLLSHKCAGIKDGFVDWLRARENLWLPACEKHREGALKTWFETNREDLEAKNYGNIHIPRFVYGMFNRERLYDALQDLPSCLEVTLLDGKVVAASKEEGGRHRLTFETPAREITLEKMAEGQIGAVKLGEAKRESLSVDREVLGVGPPEPKIFEKVKDHPDYFGNPTALHPHREGGSFAEQFRRAALEKHAETGRRVEVAVLGSGLAFLDVANVVYNDEELRKAVHLTSISKSGYTRTEGEAREGKQKDMAPESKTALAGLDVRFIAAKVEDVRPGEGGNGIHVSTSDSHLDEPGAHHKPGARTPECEHDFDLAVQTLGFGQWKEMGIYRTALEAGIIEENLSTREPAIDLDMRSGEASINGFIAEPALKASLAAKKDETGGFLSQVHRHSPWLAATLMGELFADEIRDIGLNFTGHVLCRPNLKRFELAQEAQRERAG